MLGDVKVKLILKNEKVRRRPSCIGKNVECLVVSLGCLDWIWQEAASTCYQERAFRIGRGSPTAPFSSKHSIQLLRATELEVVVPETATCILTRLEPSRALLIGTSLELQNALAPRKASIEGLGLAQRWSAVCNMPGDNEVCEGILDGSPHTVLQKIGQ